MLPVVLEREDISSYESDVYDRTALTEPTKRDREGVVMLLRRGGYWREKALTPSSVSPRPNTTLVDYGEGARGYGEGVSTEGGCQL